MANIVTPLAEGDSYDAVKTKLVSIVESWRGPGAASGGNVPATWGAMRTLLNGVAALVGLATIGASDSGASALTKINALNDDTAGGRFTGSSLDLQFANNKAYGAADPLAPLTVSRASAGMVEDASGVWTSVAANVARRTNKGILVEEARTNSIRNNSMQGAVVGTPGTLPTNWVIGLGTLSREIVGLGVENGVDCVDIRLFGSGAGSVSIQPETNTALAASEGQVWAGSFFAKLVAGSLANTSSHSTTTRSTNSGGSVVSSQAVAYTPGASLARIAAPAVTLGATSVNISTALVFAYSGAVDMTIRIGMPQLELGAFVTSPIRTTGAAATRAGDNIIVSNPASYVPFNQGSVYAEWTEVFGAATSNDRLLWLYRPDAVNVVGVRERSGDGRINSYIVTASIIQADMIGANVPVIGTDYKTALAWETNRFAMRNTASIGSPANDNSGTPPSTGSPVFYLGQYGSGAGCFNGYIRRLVLFPTPQNDAALSAMVA